MNNYMYGVESTVQSAETSPEWRKVPFSFRSDCAFPGFGGQQQMTGHTNRVIQEVMVEESGLGIKKAFRFSPVGNYRDRVHVN